MSTQKHHQLGSVKVGRQSIGETEPVFVISEIGANFDSENTAKAMIEASARAGCNAVKVQTFRAETIARADAFFTFEDGSRVSQQEFWKAHELSRELHVSLKQHAESLGLEFFSTPSYFDDVDMLDDLSVPCFKVGSDDLTNYPFLEYVAGKGKPVILSTGMSELGEVEQAVRTVLSTGNDQLILLHCLVGYPAPRHDANVRIVQTLRDNFGVLVGFSDHTRGNLASILAVSLGAVIVEKHLTLDRSPGGPDNDTSVEPQEMADLVSDVRDVRTVLGSAVKAIRPGEMKWRAAGRKSLVAAANLSAGTVLSADMITIKRPSDGVHPKYLPLLLGRRLNADLEKDAFILFDHV